MDTCDDIHLMSALIDGFCLLILHGHYNDEKLVSRLILLYFNPTTEAEVNQILSIFFETLIQHKKQDCLEAALIQTLTKIIEASSESPLHEVKIETVLKFIINSTLPVYCKAGKYLLSFVSVWANVFIDHSFISGVKIHDNISTSLLKWMKNNATNRELLKITSKEILALDISDDNEIRNKLQEYVDQLLEMPMDSKTEKNLKLFKEQMQGNRTKDIQFSSVAPANRVDGDVDEIENDGQVPSDDESVSENDVRNTEKNSDNNENPEKSSINSNDENTIDGDKEKEGQEEDGASESNESIVVPPEKENENPIENVEQRTPNKRKRVPPEDSTEILSPAKIYYSSNEVILFGQMEIQIKIYSYRTVLLIMKLPLEW